MSDFIGFFIILNKSGFITHLTVLIISCYLIKRIFDYVSISRKEKELFRCEACHKGFYCHKDDYVFRCNKCRDYPSPLWKKRYSAQAHPK